MQGSRRSGDSTDIVIWRRLVAVLHDVMICWGACRLLYEKEMADKLLGDEHPLLHASVPVSENQAV